MFILKNKVHVIYISRPSSRFLSRSCSLSVCALPSMALLTDIMRHIQHEIARENEEKKGD